MVPEYCRNVSVMLDFLGEIFQVHVSPATKDAYLLALADLPLDAIHYACYTTMHRESSLPSPAMLRTRAKAFQQCPLSLLDTSTIVQHTLPLLSKAKLYKWRSVSQSVWLRLGRERVLLWSEN